MKPFCFVFAPSGSERAPSGRTIDVADARRRLFLPAIEAAGFTAVDGPPLSGAGALPPAVVERLRISPLALIDVTTASPAVVLELGFRRARRGRASLVVFAEGEPPAGPLLAGARAYRVPDGPSSDADEGAVAALAADLRAAWAAPRRPGVDELVGDWGELSHTKTDVFRDLVAYDEGVKAQLAAARSRSGHDAVAEAVLAVERRLGDLDDAEVAVLVDVLLSYRAASAWAHMVAFVDRLPAVVAAQTMVREQYGLALNRVGRDAEAASVMTDLIAERGATPESCAILGRIHKDRSAAASAVGRHTEARDHRQRAVAAYLRGFEADWRDPYPGINAVQLIYAGDERDPRLDELIPVVTYAVRRRIEAGGGDYWDHATELELAVLGGHEQAAEWALAAAVASPHEGWMRETTADTLRRIADAGGRSWVGRLERTLRGSGGGG